MSSSAPFAGTVVPAEGVSNWLSQFLRTDSCEAGLTLIGKTIGHDTPGELALWVWPLPGMEAIGWVPNCGTHQGSAVCDERNEARITRHELQQPMPTHGTLARWSFPDCDAATIQIHCRDSFAVCWRDTNHGGIPLELLTWLETLLGWLAERDAERFDAKLRSLAEFAAGAGHEINNPLGTILGRSQLLLREENDPERRRWLTAIGGQALRIRDMISDTMVFARPPLPRRQRVAVEPLIRSVTSRFSEELARAETVFKLLCEPPGGASLFAMADSDQFQVFCIELMRNALHAVGHRSPGPRRIGIRLRPRQWRDSLWVECDVMNNGPELTAEEREHAFDPFFSGRQAGRGLGFGLTKCWRIVAGHGGYLGVHSVPDQTIFRSLWPVAPH